MATVSQIEWTEMTWNPVTGCSKVSSGCKHCYAERMAGRLHAMGSERYANGFRLTIHHDLLDAPKAWKKPRLVFVNSMSDLFHQDVPTEFIKRVFETMRDCPHHTFQILTKRSERLRELSDKLLWPSNVWMGVSVEDSRVVKRISDLVAVPAQVRFLSCEPLIGALEDLPLRGIDWVIVGGESGPGARPMRQEWVDSIHSQCKQLSVPFFFKQWGDFGEDGKPAKLKKKGHATLDGKIYHEYPA